MSQLLFLRRFAATAAAAAGAAKPRVPKATASKPRVSKAAASAASAAKASTKAAQYREAVARAADAAPSETSKSQAPLVHEAALDAMLQADDAALGDALGDEAALDDDEDGHIALDDDGDDSVGVDFATADAPAAAVDESDEHDDDVMGDDDVDVEAVVASSSSSSAPSKSGRRPRPPQPSVVIWREFEEAVARNRVTFHVVMDALQRLSVYDSPRFMQLVIRSADGVASLSPRQRMRIRYPLIGLHILHERFDKALPLLQSIENLRPLEASLSAVIVILLGRRLPAAQTLAVAIDKLMRKSECHFSPQSLSALLSYYVASNQQHEVDAVYARMVSDNVTPSSSALADYLHAQVRAGEIEKAFAAAYRARRLGVRWTAGAYAALIVSCCSRLHQLERAVELFDMGVREGIAHKPVTFESLLAECARVGDVVRIDEFVMWMTKFNVAPNTAIYDSLIRLECRRGRSSNATALYGVAVDRGVAPTSGATYAQLVECLLAVDQRRAAQQLLKSAVAHKADLERAVTIVAVAFGRDWRAAVDWLLEMRAAGMAVDAKTFAAVLSPFKGDADVANVFVALMREKQVPLPAIYRCAMYVTRNSVESTLALFRQMLDVDGITPTAHDDLTGVVHALVQADRRSEAMRFIAVTRGFMSEPISENVWMPLLQAGPVGNEHDRKHFGLDSAGKPSVAWIEALQQHAAAANAALACKTTPAMMFQQRVAVLLAEQRAIAQLMATIDAYDVRWPRHRNKCYAAVLTALVTPNEHDATDESKRVAAEAAITLFERLHKYALVSGLSEFELPIVRRFSSDVLDAAPTPSTSSSSGGSGGALDDLVQKITQRPAIMSTTHSTATTIWTAAIRACEIAQLEQQRAALEADWKRIFLLP